MWGGIRYDAFFFSFVHRHAPLDHIFFFLKRGRLCVWSDDDDDDDDDLLATSHVGVSRNAYRSLATDL